MATLTQAQALTYLEVDVDYFRITRFELERSGSAIAAWTSMWTPDVPFTCVTPGDVVGTKAARMAHGPSTSGAAFWRPTNWSAFLDVSVVAGFIRRNSAANIGLVTRGNGGLGTQTGYVLTISPSGTLVISRILAGSSSTLLSTTSPVTPTVDQQVWVRFEAFNNVSAVAQLRYKVWLGTLNDEPGDWLGTTDPGLALPSGFTGIYATGPSATIDCDHFRMRALDDGSETMRFARDANYIPMSHDALPAMVDMNVDSGTISLGKSMGVRAVVSATFRDPLYSDLGELFNKGSLFGKLRARNLFIRGNNVRVKYGKVGDALADFESRAYVLDFIDGPKPRGEFTIAARDPLKLADNDRAQAPQISNGYLAAGINSSQTTATLSPTGIGNSEYPSSGFLNIGGTEIVSFTRSGDSLTITRAQEGTTAASHNAEDRCQLCLKYTAQKSSAIIRDLLVNYTDRGDYLDTLIPISVWTTEDDTYLQRLYTRIITEPTGVNKLISELIEQAGLLVFWDDLTQVIKYQVLKGIPTTAFTYGPDNIIEGTLSLQDQPDTRLTSVWTYFGIKNPLRPLDDQDNYRNTLATEDLEVAADNGGAVVAKIHGTWIPALGRTTADRVNALQLGRFATPPRKVGFEVLRHSEINEPLQGEGYRLEYYGAQDESGDLVNIPIQVTRVTPRPDRFIVEAEEMRFSSAYDTGLNLDRTITIDSDYYNVNLRTLHDTIYAAPTLDDVSLGVSLKLLITSNGRIGATSAANIALTIGSWPTGFPIEVEVLGLVQGAGGNAGAGGAGSANNPSPGAGGGPGGTALYTRHPITLKVSVGSVRGGGGGGGGGAGGAQGLFLEGGGHGGGGGGGGAGLVPGTGGAGGPGTSPGTPGGSGGPGTVNSGGDDGEGNGNPAHFTKAGDGGTGGNPGQAGIAGDANGSVDRPQVGGAAGAAGKSLDGASFCSITGSNLAGPQVN